MSLTRKFLESLGIEADKVDAIIEAHAETVDALKGQAETYKADAERYASTKKELETANAELDSLKAVGGDYKAKYEALNTEFETYKAEQTEKDTRASKETAYRKLLKDAGIIDKRIDAVMRVTDLSAIELDENGIKDADKLTEQIKADWSDFITTTDVSGAQTTTPPANNPVNKFSHEDIAKMSAEEINNNWDAIKNSMKG